MNATHIIPFEDEAGFAKAVDTALLAATGQMCVFDRDLSCIDLESPARVAALTDFLKAGGKLRIVVHDTLRLESRSPRLLALLRNFLHSVELRRSSEDLRSLPECYLLGANGHGVVRFHVDHARGKLVCADAGEIRPWQDRFEQMWGTAEPCAIGRVLGL